MLIRVKLKNLIARVFCLFFSFNSSKPSVLAYHSINDNWHYLSISPAELEKQISYLKNNNFTFLTLSDFNNPKKYLTKRSVLLTFDDGLEDNYLNAVPILKKYNVPAIFFVSPGLLGKKFIRPEFNCMTWQQLKEISNSQLFTIGAHGLAHKKMNKLNREELIIELKESKDMLEKELDYKINSMAYPSGKYNNLVLEEVKKAGYKFGFTIKPFHLNKLTSSLEISRFNVNDFSSLFFKDIFKGGYEWYWRIRNIIF